MSEEVEDRGVDDEGGELSADDHHLVAGDVAAALLRRSNLTEVDRHCRGGAADGESEDEAGADEERGSGREHTADSAEDEDSGQGQDRLATTPGISDTTAEDRAEGGTDHEGGDDEAFAQRGQAEVLAQRLEGSVDDSGVIAEEQTAEGGDRGDDTEAMDGATCADVGEFEVRARGGRRLTTRGSGWHGRLLSPSALTHGSLPQTARVGFSPPDRSRRRKPSRRLRDCPVRRRATDRY